MNIELDTMNRSGLIQPTNLIITILIASLTAIKMVALRLDFPPIPALVIITVGLTNAIYIKCHGSKDIAAYIIVITALLGLGFSSINTGGFDAAIILLAPSIPIITLLLISARAAWLSLALVCLILAGVFVLDIYGYVSENRNSPNMVLFGRYIVLTCLCLITTWVVWSYYSISRTLLVKLEKQSNIDYLTGILNRRAIETSLLKEIMKAKHSNTWLSFIMADVDFFKLYNDSNGHQAGDDCLKDIAKLINGCCERPTDIVGRFGGEEFVLILPDTDLNGAQRVAEHLRKTILDKNIPYGPQNSNPVSLTLGIVSAQGHTINGIEKLISFADTALYEGKEQGRNCVVSKIFSVT